MIKISRRALLKSALLATAPLPLLAQEVETNGFQAVRFDGHTFLTNPGDSPDLPSQSEYGFVSYNFQANSKNNGGDGAILTAGYAPSGPVGNAMQILHGPGYYGETVEIGLSGGGDGAGWSKSWYLNPDGPYDGNWHNIQIGWTFGKNPAASATLDGRQMKVQFTTPPIPYVNPTINYAGRPIFVGGLPQPQATPTNFIGQIADLFCYFGVQIDAADPKIIAGFYDTQNQVAVRNSPDGQTAIPGQVPQVGLVGDKARLKQNLPSSIGHFSWTSSNPQSSFATGGGELLLADSDPWNYPVVGTSAAATTARIISARKRRGLPVR